METATVSDFIEAEGIETEAKHVGTGCPWSEGWDCGARLRSFLGYAGLKRLQATKRL